MSLLYYPRVGEILVCHYGNDTIAPEMVKSRPVVVIGPRLRRRADLVGVVPLSTTAPRHVENYHASITLQHPLPRPFDSLEMWAKCDMFSVVSRQRLDRFKEPQQRYGGPRKWVSGFLDAEQIALIRTALALSLGFAPP